jgi:hypothetical protein
MKNKIVAVLVGFVITLALYMWIGFKEAHYINFAHITDYFSGLSVVFLKSFVVNTLLQSIPPLIGGIAVGVVVRRRGILFGILTVILIQVWFTAWYNYEVYLFRHMLGITIETYIRDYVRWALVHVLWLFSFRLCAGAVGGHLGQLLASKWRKRKQE